ncbi:unnamed protein product, partial [Ectocarpus sp. 8 AP-2014]
MIAASATMAALRGVVLLPRSRSRTLEGVVAPWPSLAARARSPVVDLLARFRPVAQGSCCSLGAAAGFTPPSSGSRVATTTVSLLAASPGVSHERRFTFSMLEGSWCAGGGVALVVDAEVVRCAHRPEYPPALSTSLASDVAA